MSVSVSWLACDGIPTASFVKTCISSGRMWGFEVVTKNSVCRERLDGNQIPVLGMIGKGRRWILLKDSSFQLKMHGLWSVNRSGEGSESPRPVPHRQSSIKLGNRILRVRIIRLDALSSAILAKVDCSSHNRICVDRSCFYPYMGGLLKYRCCRRDPKTLGDLGRKGLFTPGFARCQGRVADRR